MIHTIKSSYIYTLYMNINAVLSHYERIYILNFIYNESKGYLM